MFNDTRRNCILDLSTVTASVSSMQMDQQPILRKAISRVDISAASNVALILIILMVFCIAIMHLHAPLSNVEFVLEGEAWKNHTGQLKC